MAPPNLPRAGPADFDYCCGDDCINRSDTTCCNTAAGFMTCSSGDACVFDYDHRINNEINDYYHTCCAPQPDIYLGM